MSKLFVDFSNVYDMLINVCRKVRELIKKEGSDNKNEGSDGKQGRE